MAFERGIAESIPFAVTKSGVPAAPGASFALTIRKDGGAANAVDDTIGEVHIAAGVCLVDLTETEKTADSIILQWTDGDDQIDDGAICFLTEENYTAARAPYLDTLNWLALEFTYNSICYGGEVGWHTDLTQRADNWYKGSYAMTPNGEVMPITGSHTESGGTYLYMNAAAYPKEALTPGTTCLLVRIWSQFAAIAGDEMDLVDAPNATAITAIQKDLALEATLTAMKGAGWTDETLVSLQASIELLTGGGANTVTVTASNGSGTLANGVPVTVTDASDNTVGVLTTNALGVATFYLDDGDYTFVTGTTTSWAGSSTDATVSGATAVALTLTAQAIPAAGSAAVYLLYYYATDENGALVGENERYLRVTAAMPTHDAANNLILSTEKQAVGSTSGGLISFDCPKTVTWMRIEIQWDNELGDQGTEEYEFAIDSDEANASDQISIADLLT